MNKIKVKRPDFRRFKNNKLTVVLGLATATIISLIALKVWLSEEESFLGKLGDSILRSADQTPSQIEFHPETTTSVEAAKIKLKAKTRRERLQNPILARETYRYQQQRLLKEFQDTIHLKMNFPEHMHYTPVDLEDDIGAVYGTTMNLDQSFAVLATSRKVSVKDAVDFLKENRQALPMLKGHTLEPDKAFNFKPPKETGLRDLTVIPSTDSKGKSLYSVFAPRADGKGNYLFMMEAKKSFFDENEDGLERMLDGMSAQP